ncbi:MAG: DUF1684 domain-containing protein [Pedobacter sp.]|nr:MAG: DUF1684 domain-containing protein [Pedobacter sp.]
MHKSHYITLFISVLFSLLNLAKAQNYDTEIAIHRDTYKANFLKDARSPLIATDFEHLHFYPATKSFKVLAKVKALKKQKSFTMPTFDGTGKKFIRQYALTFQLNNQNYTLIAYKNLDLATNPAYKDYLFIPFTDQSNGKETYAGGRYMDVKAGDIDKKTIWLDFNKAYNPYCAYSDGYRCPIPPAENDLVTIISAGEKNYTGTKKKANN